MVVLMTVGVSFLLPDASVGQEDLEEVHIPSYRRSDWPHWTDDDHDCQTTRTEVLAEESLSPVTWDEQGCRVIAGEWVDAYSGEFVSDPRVLDVDHVLALQLAHYSGGWRWSREKKRDYANNLDEPDHLFAVTARMNRQKGAKGPSRWLPPLEDSHCWYLSVFHGIANRWNLELPPADQRVMARSLGACDGGEMDKSARARSTIHAAADSGALLGLPGGDRPTRQWVVFRPDR